MEAQFLFDVKKRRRVGCASNQTLTENVGIIGAASPDHVVVRGVVEKAAGDRRAARRHELNERVGAGVRQRGEAAYLTRVEARLEPRQRVMQSS